MKRLFSALILFVIIISLCIWGNINVNKYCNKMEKRIEMCAALYETDRKECLSLCEDIKKDWNSSSAKMSFFINHGYIDDMSLKITTLPLYAKSNRKDVFLADCEEIKQIISQIKRDDKITADTFY